MSPPNSVKTSPCTLHECPCGKVKYFNSWVQPTDEVKEKIKAAEVHGGLTRRRVLCPICKVQKEGPHA